MRKSALNALLPRTRQGVLVELVLKSRGPRYLSDLARELKVAPSSLQRELARLVHADIVVRRKEGTRILYETNVRCPFLPELRGLLTKTVGIHDVLVRALEPLRDRIRLAFVFGSVAKNEEHSQSDVDIMIVGDLGMFDVSLAIHDAQAELGRELNPVVYSPAEFAKRVREKQHFVTAVLEGSKVFLVGGDLELENTIGRSSCEPAQADPSRNRRTAQPRGARTR